MSITADEFNALSDADKMAYVNRVSLAYEATIAELRAALAAERKAAAKVLRNVRKIRVYGNSVFVEYRGHSAWAVTRNGECLCRNGEWEYEPVPSARDDDFITRTRFATIEQAIESARASQIKKG